MRTSWCARMGLAAVLAMGCGLLPASAARAQGYRVPSFRGRPYLGVGYVASIPDAFLGAAVLTLTPKILGGAGLYADVKLSGSTPASDPEYEPTITVNQADNVYLDQLYMHKSTWRVVDVALVYVLTPELAAYAGAGYAKETHYRQYFDASRTRGFAGFYWISDPAASGTRVNALGGLLLRAGRFLSFQMGVESKPPGVDVGAMLTLPL